MSFIKDLTELNVLGCNDLHRLRNSIIRSVNEISTESICIFLNINSDDFKWDYDDSEYHPNEISFKCNDIIDYINKVEAQYFEWMNNLGPDRVLDE